MMLLGWVAALLLAALAGLHVYWGTGGVWPGTDPKSCARAVAGFKGIERMPPPASAFAVAATLAAVALIALTLGGAIDPLLPGLFVSLAGLGAAAIFLGRGIAGFTPAWRRLTPEMPFARNDRLFFSPLCLTIGAALIILSWQRIAA